MLHLDIPESCQVVLPVPHIYLFSRKAHGARGIRIIFTFRRGRTCWESILLSYTIEIGILTVTKNRSEYLFFPFLALNVFVIVSLHKLSDTQYISVKITISLTLLKKIRFSQTILFSVAIQQCYFRERRQRRHIIYYSAYLGCCPSLSPLVL